MTFADRITEFCERERIENERRIRAQSALRCARLQISDANVIAAFADKAAELRAAGNDPEPCLLMAREVVMREAA
jgi:hypothetical protein